MKVAVSIPEPVFSEAERLVQRLQTSRSEIYARALRAFVAAHTPDQVTRTMNEVVDAVGREDEAFVGVAARRALDRTEWK